MALRIHSSLTNYFNKVIFLRFYNELKFHILSIDGKILGLSPGIKMSVSSKSGHRTFVLSTVDVVDTGLLALCYWFAVVLPTDKWFVMHKTLRQVYSDFLLCVQERWNHVMKPSWDVDCDHVLMTARSGRETRWNALKSCRVIRAPCCACSMTTTSSCLVPVMPQSGQWFRWIVSLVRSVTQQQIQRWGPGSIWLQCCEIWEDPLGSRPCLDLLAEFIA